MSLNKTMTTSTLQSCTKKIDIQLTVISVAKTISNSINHQNLNQAHL